MLNKQIGHNSLKIAELSAREGYGMRFLTQLALKDSTAMRYLAMITTWFLPATYLAVSIKLMQACCPS
jgi:hypothetical protein